MQIPANSVRSLVLLESDNLLESNDIMLYRPDVSEHFCLKSTTLYFGTGRRLCGEQVHMHT